MAASDTYDKFVLVSLKLELRGLQQIRKYLMTISERVATNTKISNDYQQEGCNEDFSPVAKLKTLKG